MSRSFIRTNILRAGLLIGAAGLTACSAAYSTGNNSTVLLVIAAVNGGSPLNSDVCTGDTGCTVRADTAELAIAVRFKNPNIETVPQIPSAVVIERYEVKYRRSDGRGVEGQDVPYAISGNVTAAYDVKTSGTDPLVIEVVRVQAKLEKPLSNLRGLVPNVLSGSALSVTMFADITIHGHTISGQAVSATGSLQINFADSAE